MKKLREFFEALSQWIQLICLIVYIVVMFILILKILEPMSMAITFMIAAILTIHTFGRKLLVTGAFVGIFLYVLSWPVTGKYGLCIGLSVWATGFFLWFWAVYQSFKSIPQRIS